MPDLSKVTALLPDITDYLVYAAIGIVTLIGFFKCLIPLWNTTSALRRAVGRLQDDAGNTGKPIWQESHFMGKRLRGCWLRFLQNAEQLDRRGLPTNVEDYINDDTVTHGPGNATLAELIPNLLTSLGILGTFLGLSRGLSSLNFADASQLIGGIPDLLSGMKFAFGTSVAGISCSLIFNMLNRISQGSSYRAIDDFVSSFTQLAMSRPLDNDVQLICQNQDRNHMLQGINDTLALKLAENVGSAVTRSLAPVAGTVDRFIIAATRNQIEGVNQIVERFMEQMNMTLGDRFSSFGAVMDAVTSNQIHAVHQAEDTLRSAGGIIDNARTLQALTDNVLVRFDAYVNEMQKNRVRDENFDREAARLLARMEDQNKSLGDLINKLSLKIEAMSSAEESTSSDQALAGICRVTEELNSTVRSISDTLSELSREV